MDLRGWGVDGNEGSDGLNGLEALNACGGPLSPLLANLLPDGLDRELEARGHRFVRYADDCNIHVGSRRAGVRVMGSISGFLTDRLKLKVNDRSEG